MEIACPKCGSHDLYAGKKGFSGKKAVAGAVLTGGIGVLAGTIGSNKVKITCLNCGHTFYAGDIQKKAQQEKFNKDLSEGKPGALIALGIVIGIIILILFLFAKACSGNDAPIKTSNTSMVDTSTAAPITQSQAIKKNLKFDLLYPGDWIISSQYPEEQDPSYTRLNNIYTNNEIFGSDGDYIHAKKSNKFESDHKFILAVFVNEQTWKYYTVNIKTGKVKAFNPGPTEITPPNISAFGH